MRRARGAPLLPVCSCCLRRRDHCQASTVLTLRQMADGQGRTRPGPAAPLSRLWAHRVLHPQSSPTPHLLARPNASPPSPRPPPPAALSSSAPGTLELHIPFSPNAPHSVCLLPPPALTLASQLLKGRCPGHEPRNKRTSGRAQSLGQVLSTWLCDAGALPGLDPSGPSASAQWPSCWPASALAPPLPPLLQSLRKPTNPPSQQPSVPH